MATQKKNFVAKAVDLYVDGFRSMTIGRKLWLMIAITLAIFFLVLKLFFFPDILNENYATDAERADAVRSALQAAPDTESPSGTPWTNLESQ